jgi:hypothetical protein
MPSSIPSNLHFVSCYEKTLTRGKCQNLTSEFFFKFFVLVAGLSTNEFNASMFMRQSPNNVALQRARSLLEVQKHDVWRYYPSPSNHVSLTPGKKINFR